MGLSDRTATMAGLRRFEDPTLMDLVRRIDVLDEERLPVLASRLELETVDGRQLEAEFVPDDSTYGWDWDGVLRNAHQLAAEMQGGERALTRLSECLRGFDGLPSVAPLMETLSAPQ